LDLLVRAKRSESRPDGLASERRRSRVRQTVAKLPAAKRVEVRVRRFAAKCYVDLNSDYRKSIFISSSGRSGSTWIANVINYRNDYRLIFEPFRRDHVGIARDIRYGQYLDPSRRSNQLAPAIEAILRGQVREWSADRYNTKRLVTKRLIKDIRTTNLLPWIHHNFHDLPMIYLLRHPFAVATSFTRLGWRDFLSEFLAQADLMRVHFRRFQPVIEDIAHNGDLFDRHVLRWCLENYVPLSTLETGDVHLIFYEQFVDDPFAELRRLGSYLGIDFEDEVLAALPVPSRMTFPEAAARSRSDEELRRAVDIVGEFGLDRIYALNRRPRLPPDSPLLFA
jgi:hypothetical protein